MNELHLFNPDKYNKQSIRYPGYNYSQPGHYFVTICAKDRECMFGKIKNEAIELSGLGIIVQTEWLKTPSLRSNVLLDEFIVMPNHVHGIIEIINPIGGLNVGIDCPPQADPPQADNQSGTLNTHDSHRQPHPFGPQSNNLFTIIRGFKGATTKQINLLKGNIEGGTIWQSRFYDNIIDTDDQLEIVRNYIRENPKNWDTDRNNPKNPF